MIDHVKGRTMSRTATVLALAALVLPANAHKTTVDFDHGRHFSGYRTYTWAEPPSVTGDLPFPNQLMRQRITEYIEEALAARGFRRVPVNGDLLISYQVEVSEEPVYTTTGDNWGWGWNSDISTTWLNLIYHGTLVVDLRDARQKRLVFQGVSTHTISSKPSKNSKKLAEAVRDIFRKYPPQL